MTIWMDLTNSLTQHKGNVVGIVRAELMLAKFLHELDPSVRFSILTQFGFKEVKKADLKWLFDSDNVGYNYLRYQKSKKIYFRFFEKIRIKIEKNIFKIKRHQREKGISKKEFVMHPYKEGDLVYSCGWFGTQKEEFFSRISSQLSNFNLVYTIYDLCVIKDDMNYLYYPYNCPFYAYIEWIAKNCSAVIYGGKTAQKDAEKHFKSYPLPVLDGHPIKWGNDFALISNKSDILKRLNITSPYILAVGSIDFKKNYKVLYRAYCMLKQNHINNIPQLIIVGRFIGTDPEFEQILKTNPLIKDSITIVQCSDEDLDLLYTHCLFTVLPTLYEGWSLTLPESFYHGKLCICSDVAPLREVGENFAYYVNPYHPKDWMKAIEYFINRPEEIKKFEKNIHKNWKSISWQDSSQSLYRYLSSIYEGNHSKNNEPVLYYDVGLLFYPNLSGIPRTQMLLARYLYLYRKNIKFFWLSQGKYHELSVTQLSHLLSKENLDKAVTEDRKNINNYISKPKLPFNKNDIIFSAGAGYDERSYNLLMSAHKKVGFKYCQVLYDFTPILVPHLHEDKSVIAAVTHFNRTYETADFIFYGGRTAQKDGEIYQKKYGWPIKNSIALRWGNDIVSHKYTQQQKDEILKKYGITNNFILTVGTIEARKNHETLYQAYLELLKDESLKDRLPQLIICGHIGWKTQNLIRLLNVDNRIRGKIIYITPNDMELDVLYKSCLFTCLASFYEGWSLTLPESLNYGKFCLASDTPSLVETGEDIIDYANPYDPVEWAEKIKFYCTHKDALKQREKLIKEKWHNTTWKECAKNINDTIEKLFKEEKA